MEFDWYVIPTKHEVDVGTPIINSVDDLYAQLRFLRYTGGFADQATFTRMITRPLKSGNPAAVSRLQMLMAATTLRRKKEMQFQGKKNLEFPCVDEYLHKVGRTFSRANCLTLKISHRVREQNTMFWRVMHLV